MTMAINLENNSHLAVGRAIVLELALATQLQLDVAHATHAARLFAVNLADASFGGGRVGMRLAPRAWPRQWRAPAS